MCLVKVKGEVEDDVIVPARVVEREHEHRETQIVQTAPAVIERPPRPRSHRYSSSSSSSSSRSSASYDRSRHDRRQRRHITDDASSSFDGRSSRSGRSRSRERGYYREHERVVSGGSYGRSDNGVRSSYRYVDPAPRGAGNNESEVRQGEIIQKIIRAEEHLQRAAEIQERERRRRGEPRQIAYDPRSSTASHRSYEHSRDGSRRRSEVVVVQEERHRDRYSSR